MTAQEAQKLAKSTLSSKRYRHEKNVVKMARKLAKIYGADVERAETAAWLHDIMKEKPKGELLQLLQQDAIIAAQTEERPFPVWHGPCAAVYAANELGVTDADILSAIDCHTTGKPGMSLLDKILYVADMTSAERDYPGVRELRALAKKDLDAAVVASMRRSIHYIKQRGKSLDEESLQALASMESSTGK